MALFIAQLILFLSVVHLYHNWRVQPNSLYLSFALVFAALTVISNYLFVLGTSVFWLALIFNHFTPCYLLVGPLLYFYVRGTLTDTSRLRKRDLVHFIPAVLQLLLIIPYIFKPWSYKVWLATEMVSDFHRLFELQNHLITPTSFNSVVRFISMFGYLLYSLHIWWRFRNHYPSKLRIPEKEAQMTIRFLGYLLVVSLIAVLCPLLLVILFLNNPSIDMGQQISRILLGINAFSLLWIPILLQMHPQVMYGIPRWRKEGQEEMDAETWLTYEEPDDPEAVVGVVQPEESNRFHILGDRIRQIMDEQEPYLDPEFTLEDLVRLVDVPKHHVYYCLNTILKVKFTQLRTEYRVLHAKQLIDQGATRDKTLEAIGWEAGFSSRSTFISAFREVIGKTPSDYARSDFFPKT